MDLLFLLFSFWLDIYHTKEDLMFELAALRHQLIVYKRREKKRPIINDSDRIFWCFLSKLWKRWKDVLCIVKPETVVDWHRRTFKAYWTWKSRPTGKPGRPKTPEDIRNLIMEIASANPSWGAPRMHGELRKLGVKVSQSTVSNFMPERDDNPEPSQTWATFISNHIGGLKRLVACDFSSYQLLPSTSYTALSYWIWTEGRLFPMALQSIQRLNGLQTLS